MAPLQLTRTRTSRSPTTRSRGGATHPRNCLRLRRPSPGSELDPRGVPASGTRPRSRLFFQLVLSRYEQVSLTLSGNLPFARSGRRVRRPSRPMAMTGRIVHLVNVPAPHDQSFLTPVGRWLSRARMGVVNVDVPAAAPPRSILSA